jgi:hypothetical protein
MINGNYHIYMGQQYSTRRNHTRLEAGLFKAARAIGVDPNQRTAGTPATGSRCGGRAFGPHPHLSGWPCEPQLDDHQTALDLGQHAQPASSRSRGFGGPGGPTRRSGGGGAAAAAILILARSVRSSTLGCDRLNQAAL